MKSVTTLVAFALLLITPAFAQHGAEITAAEQSARSWLALTDNEEYAASWARAASYFRAAITQEDWATALQGARSPLGALQSRDVSSSTYTTTLPGAPDGEYVVFAFNASFANKAAAVETVTVMKDIDGSWRVGGYFIR